MASLVLAVSLLLAAFSSPLVDAANYSSDYNLAASSLFSSPLVDADANYSSDYNFAAGSLNPIDACWRRNPKWAAPRQALASCAVGFGKAALGGKQGGIYIVTSPADDVKPGTLRFGVTQAKPLWITFARDMVIVLKNELIVKSFKTIDGRGAKVDIGNGPCITINRATNVIIHGISIHDCRLRKGWDGDAIRVFQSSHVWIDHCLLSRCQDGLIDVVHGSTSVTISNCRFANHVKAVLLGHSDNFMGDKKMKVTVVYNHFGPGVSERMPRVRRGYAHVANNMYDKWKVYAIGGSADPIIFSEGNYFLAPNDASKKQVTKRMVKGPAPKNWKWGTAKDVFKNGAFFVPSGGGAVTPTYAGGEAFQVAHGNLAPSLSASAGPLRCVPGRIC